jgi:hypothetical protein
MAAAILDRVLERGRFIHLDGPSGRTRHLNLEEILPAPLSSIRAVFACAVSRFDSVYMGAVRFVSSKMADKNRLTPPRVLGDNPASANEIYGCWWDYES